MISSLNDLEVKLGDILNAYVQAPVTEKVWTTLGPEFSKDARKTVVIVRALYGLESAGAAFRSQLVRCMEFLECKSCKTDPDLWKSDQKMGYSITPIYYVMRMTLFVSTTMQMLCYSGYISPSHLSCRKNQLR